MQLTLPAASQTHPMAAMGAYSDSPVTRGIVRPQGGSLSCNSYLCCFSVCLLSQQSPIASSLEGAIGRRAGTQTRALDAILYHPQQSHLVGSTALGLTLSLLYPRKLSLGVERSTLGMGNGRPWGMMSILALEITLNPLPII